MTNTRTLHPFAFLGVVLCAMLFASCTNSVATSDSNSTLTAASTTLKKPIDYWRDWKEPFLNPMVSPKPSFKAKVIDPLQGNYEALSQIMQFVSSSIEFSNPTDQVPVLDAMYDAAVKNPEKMPLFKSRYVSLTTTFPQLQPRLMKYEKLLK